MIPQSKRLATLLTFGISFVTGSRKSGSHSSDLVPAPDEERLLNPSNDNEGFTKSPRYTLDRSLWITTLAILSIAVTIHNLFVLQLSTPRPTSDYLEVSFARPYNGLEKIPRNESSPLWPLSSIHYPDFIGSTEGTVVHHALGNHTVVRFDPERSVVLQHRVRDYGLEHCAIQVQFLHPSGKQHGHTPRGYGYVGESPYLTLWRVMDDTGREAALVPSAIPQSLPSGREFLGNITLDDMHHTQSPFFGCRSGSVQTLEIALACASGECVTEFWLMRSPKRQGFWIVQSEQG